MKMLKLDQTLSNEPGTTASCACPPDASLPEVRRKLLKASYAMCEQLGQPYQFFLCYVLIVISKLAEEAGALWLACDAVRILDDLSKLDIQHTTRRCEKLHSGIVAFCAS